MEVLVDTAEASMIFHDSVRHRFLVGEATTLAKAFRRAVAGDRNALHIRKASISMEESFPHNQADNIVTNLACAKEPGAPRKTIFEQGSTAANLSMRTKKRPRGQEGNMSRLQLTKRQHHHPHAHTSTHVDSQSFRARARSV